MKFCNRVALFFWLLRGVFGEMINANFANDKKYSKVKIIVVIDAGIIKELSKWRKNEIIIIIFDV